MRLNFTYIKEHQKIALHILLWAAIFSFPYFFAIQAEEGSHPSEIAIKVRHLNTAMNIFWVLTFYLNTFILVPRLLYQRKVLLYIMANCMVFVVILFFNRQIYDFLVIGKPFYISKAIIYNGVPFLFFVLLSIAFKSVSDRIRMERMAKERESENLKTELAFLRSQISPHFLFNVLNNMVALVRMGSNELEPVILKLSSLLQYMLYETDEEKVLLKSEVDYLQSYIDLQKLRFGDRIDLNIDLRPKEDWHLLEPMLLIPFVENAFKHGTGMINGPAIAISLGAEDNKLSFSVKNKYIDGDKAKDKVAGIGLANVQRRLDLLYGNKHSLKIDRTGEWFTVDLQLELGS